MNHFLVVVDMQRDFVNGSLGTAEAESIIPQAVEKIRGFEGEIFVTYDTHFEDYLESAEGKKLPVPHCIQYTPGWELDDRIAEALEGKPVTRVEKHTFGSDELPDLIFGKSVDDDFSIELIGLCTDICVVSNALLLKANFPEIPISVRASCCAGVTPEKHEAALETMRSCQIDIA